MSKEVGVKLERTTPPPLPERGSEGVKKVKETRYFECEDCGLHEEYEWYGVSVPFCPSFVFREESYVARDPFSMGANNNNNFLLLGSNCSICCRRTCQECSVFFSRRFCARCFKASSHLLPQQLKSSKKSINNT